MLNQLAIASGSRGMAGRRQAIDLASVGRLGREELEFMHIRKTGALIRAAVLLGARAGGARRRRARRAWTTLPTKVVGLLFQVVDDVLDAEADTATLARPRARTPTTTSRPT